MATVALLTISNIFMTIAWYGHLKFKQSPLWKVVVISWAIAFVEYCFQVPANRIGHYQFTAAQLKTMQEVFAMAAGGVALLRHAPACAIAACVPAGGAPTGPKP